MGFCENYVDYLNTCKLKESFVYGRLDWTEAKYQRIISRGGKIKWSEMEALADAVNREMVFFFPEAYENYKKELEVEKERQNKIKKYGGDVRIYYCDDNHQETNQDVEIVRNLCKLCDILDMIIFGNN